MASFLKEPDIHTYGMSISPMETFRHMAKLGGNGLHPGSGRLRVTVGALHQAGEDATTARHRGRAVSTKLQPMLNNLRRGPLVFSLAFILLHLGIRTLQVEGALTRLELPLRPGLTNVNVNTLVDHEADVA
jgi:hypothetical protein